MRNTAKQCRGVGDVLRALQTRGEWLGRNACVFFVGGPWHGVLRTWIDDHLHNRNHVKEGSCSTFPPKSEANACLTLNDEATKKASFLRSLVGDVAGDEDVESPSFCLFPGLGSGASSQIGVAGTTYELPFTVAEAAAHIRRQPGLFQAGGHFDRNHLPPRITGDQNVSSSAAHDCMNVFLRHRTADLIALDLDEEPAMEFASQCPAALTDYVEDIRNSLALSAYLLKPSGALLLRFPLYAMTNGVEEFRVLMRHMKCRFQVSAHEIEGGYVYYMGCRSVAGGMQAASHTTSFRPPADKPKGRFIKHSQRARANAPYFSALMPSYTNASRVKEQLESASLSTGEATGSAEVNAEAFFNMSVEMAEQGLHNHKRDD
ncbi:unnamed protein product [Trypanosoma congolense IL3000]|uniref:WGS project CAEQ00000000 data, annotated contig 863 n=1 Tax=Trypanosoma congolense (strain IL3000) TaxID=1068625 RepID=F9WJ27_TRYCI|nr:unnamed protein product [Trypanosoma congolense IL3000]